MCDSLPSHSFDRVLEWTKCSFNFGDRICNERFAPLDFRQEQNRSSFCQYFNRSALLLLQPTPGRLRTPTTLALSTYLAALRLTEEILHQCEYACSDNPRNLHIDLFPSPGTAHPPEWKRSCITQDKEQRLHLRSGGEWRN